MGGAVNNGFAGNGGSGGGAFGQRGAVDGASSPNGTFNTIGGIGQGRTTRAFGEAGGTLYSSGGDGHNAWVSGYRDGAPNTGNGGAAIVQHSGEPANTGGSGIILIRNKR